MCPSRCCSSAGSFSYLFLPADSGIGTILPPSHIIRHLEAFEKNPLESASTSASHNPAEKGKGKFKRPASPSLMSFDRNVRSKVTKGERKQPSGKSSADSGIASNVGSPASSSSSFSGGPGATPASDQAALKARLQAKLLEFRSKYASTSNVGTVHILIDWNWPRFMRLLRDVVGVLVTWRKFGRVWFMPGPLFILKDEQNI